MNTDIFVSCFDELSEQHRFAIYGYGGIGKYIHQQMLDRGCTPVALIDDGGCDSKTLTFDQFLQSDNFTQDIVILICMSHFGAVEQKVKQQVLNYFVVDPTYTKDEHRFKAVSTSVGTLFLSTQNNALKLIANNFLIIEPDTLRWLQRSANPGACLYDVGASTGCFSLFASMAGFGKVIAFEPDALSFAQIAIQRYKNYQALGSIQFLNIALGESAQLLPLNVANATAGAHSKTIADRNKPSEPKPEAVQDNGSANEKLFQDVLVMGLDEVIKTFHLPVPSHLKVDVDGFETLVLRGASNTLHNPLLQELLIEFDSNSYALNAAFLQEHGFVLAARHDIKELTGTVITGINNYLFVRKST